MNKMKMLLAVMALGVASITNAVTLEDPQTAMVNSQLKIGFMFEEIIFEQSAIAKLYKPRLEEQQRQADAKIAELVAEFQKLQKQFEEEKGISTDEELLAIQQQMQVKEQQVQSIQQQVAQIVTNFGQSFSQQFGAVYRSALELIVQEKQLDMVFDATTLFHVNPQLDISQEVLRKFDELTAASYEQLKAQLEAQSAQQ